MNRIERNNKDKLIRRIQQIPTLPIISEKIVSILGNETASFKELVRIIEKDQALAIKIWIISELVGVKLAKWLVL